MASRGRPTTANQKTKDAIIERLSDGEPLAQICRDEEMPAVRTVSDWRAADDVFNADFARARETGHDAIAARVRDIARGGEGSSFDVQRDKLIVDTDLKLLAKWDKRYNDKLQVESAATVTHRYDLDSLEDCELANLEALLAKSQRGEGGASEA